MYMHQTVVRKFTPIPADIVSNITSYLTFYLKLFEILLILSDIWEVSSEFLAQVVTVLIFLSIPSTIN